jgi:hypothetical protein
MPTPWLDTGGFFMWWRQAFDTTAAPTDAAADSRLTVRADLTPQPS